MFIHGFLEIGFVFTFMVYLVRRKMSGIVFVLPVFHLDFHVYDDLFAIRGGQTIANHEGTEKGFLGHFLIPIDGWTVVKLT